MFSKCKWSSSQKNDAPDVSLYLPLDVCVSLQSIQSVSTFLYSNTLFLFLFSFSSSGRLHRLVSRLPEIQGASGGTRADQMCFILWIYTSQLHSRTECWTQPYVVQKCRTWGVWGTHQLWRHEDEQGGRRHLVPTSGVRRRGLLFLCIEVNLNNLWHKHSSNILMLLTSLATHFLPHAAIFQVDEQLSAFLPCSNATDSLNH